MPSKNATSARLTQWLAIALVIILLDQFTKVMVMGSFQLGDSRFVTSFFNLVRAHNTGAAFSFLAGAAGWQRWFFTALGLVATVVIVFLLKRHGHQSLFATALSFILGGAIGNVIDRLLHGYVVDFIQVHYSGWYFPAFNLADSAITLGAILLIWDELRRVRKS
jgi:signal peptidase II